MDREKKGSVLEALFVDEDKVTDELVKELLAPYLGLAKTTDKIVPKPEFTKLSQRKRVLLYLLSRHAMVRLQVPGATLEVGRGQVPGNCLVSPKAAGEILSRLKADGMVEKSKGGYFVPVHSLLRVASELRKKDG
jgi:hypothetical protein